MSGYSTVIHFPLTVLFFILISEWLIPAPLFALNEAFLSDIPFQVGGTLKHETAFRVGHTATFTKLLNILDLRVHSPIHRRLRLTVIGRGFFDAIYRLKDEETIRGRENPSGDVYDVRDEGVKLKEAYMDVSTDRMDIRFGKQIVRWGVVEGFRITDVLNPLDFKEYILRGVEDRYRPLWMIRADYFGDRWETEVVWIPDLRFHKPAPAGSEWEEFQLPPNIPEPALTLENTEVGLRLKTDVWDGDMGLSYFYTWDDFPAAFRSVFGLGGNLEGISFSPRYTRLHLFGVTFSKSLGGFVVGGEAAYTLGKFFSTFPDPASPTQNEVRRDLIKYGLLVDTVLVETDLSLQFSQQIIPDYEEPILENQFESAISLFLRREMLYNRLIPQVLILYFLTHTEFVIRPKVDYKWTDRITVTAGMDIFEGPPSGNTPGDFRFVGFFRNHDRVYLELQYGF